MENFAVDVRAANGTTRHRTWFKTRAEAVKAANSRNLGLPVGPTDRVVVLELAPVQDDDEPRCPGCGCKPGDGTTPGCVEETGCGYMMTELDVLRVYVDHGAPCEAAFVKALRAYEKTGDHDHGAGKLPPGAVCPGGDCLVHRARVALGYVEVRL